MRCIRFQYQGETYYGEVQGDKVSFFDRSYLEPNFQKTNQEVSIEQVKLLPPVIPTKIVCVGLNYTKHIEELGHSVHEDPVIFLKPVTSLIGPEDDIITPKMSKRIDYEAELVVVIGKTMKDIPEDRVGEYIFGYTCGNDVTARDLQEKDGQWTRCKGFDTFCPIGPWIETDIDPSHLNIRSLLNGEVKQSSNTKYFLYSVPKLVSYISQIMTLYPGDLIMTGTPEGVGPMKAGDEIIVEIEGIGALRNYLR